MFEPAILAAIRTRLDRAQALGDRRYRPFVVARATVGAIDDARAARLAAFGTSVFTVQRDAVTLAPRLADEPSHPAGTVLESDRVFHRGTGEGWAGDADF